VQVKRSSALAYPSPEGGGWTRVSASGWMGCAFHLRLGPHPSRARYRSALATLPERGGIARLLLALCLLIGFASPTQAQDTYPSRPITLIVPYAAGGSIDLVARILAEGLTARLGQTVVVDDRPGGNGVIGIREAIKAKPDGYTLQMGSVGANVTPAAVQKDYPFDPLRDYVPVAMVAEWSAILVVKKDLPVNTLAEFVAYAKARPGALNFGTTGYGSFAHLVSEVFMQQTGVSMQHVQYKGGAPATTDLLAGVIDAHMMSSAVGAGHAENPRLKMLAVASARRLPSIPKVPTMAEAGVSGVDQTSWLCVFGPPGVADGVRERIAREVVAIASDPVYQAKFRNTGFEPLGLDAAATARMYRDEVTRWTAFIRARGLTEKAN
jgi:tripartite-type tricarboxylate transporter receptor subunit TctC